MPPTRHPAPPLPPAAPDALARLIDLANAVRENPNAPVAMLDEILRRHGEPDPDEPAAEPVIDAPGAARLRAALRQLTPILAESDVDTAAAALNTLLARHAAPPRLSRHGGTPWHVHVDSADDADWAEWLLTASALALALAVAARGRCAWGVCAAEGCGRYFADTGPGSPQRFCTRRCASRTRVAAYRLRRA
jgi:predicted RNA-binding Zn ribbon-like protein